MSRCDSVIVHYGPCEPTLDLAREALTWSGKVIVIANDLQPRPRGCSTRVEWVVPARNVGFGEALNIACERSSAEVILALNNDIVLGIDAVELCLMEFADPNVAVAGPVLRFADGTVQSAGGKLSRMLQLPCMDLRIPREPQDCVWVTGAVMALRRETLATLKMDGAFFLGCEDVDYCLRVRSVGKRVRLVPATHALHHGSTVINGPRWHYYVTRNPVWLARKHSSGPRWLTTLALKVILTLRVSIADVVKGRGTARTVSCIYGLGDAIRRKPDHVPWPDEPRPSRWLSW